MRFEYLTSNGEKKTYDLDVDKTFFTSLTDDERKKLLEENKGLTLKLNQVKSAIKDLETNPKIKKEFKKISAELDNINEKLFGEGFKKGLYEQYKYQQGQLARALLNPEKDKQLQESTVNKIKSEMENINQNIFALIKEKGAIITGEVGGKYQQLKTELDNLEAKFNGNTAKMVADLGQEKTGAFGQIISSQNGDAKLSYQEFIEGYPLLKNEETYNQHKFPLNPRP